MLAPYSTTVLQPNEKLLAKQISHRTTLTIREKKKLSSPFYRGFETRAEFRFSPENSNVLILLLEIEICVRKTVRLEKYYDIKTFNLKKTDICYRNQAGI